MLYVSEFRQPVYARKTWDIPFLTVAYCFLLFLCFIPEFQKVSLLHMI